MKRLRTAILIAAVSMAGLLTSCGSGIKMVKIPGMDIKMSATQITQGQYERVMGENPSWYKQSNKDLADDYRNIILKDTSDYPVEYISWYDAIYFCNKLSVKEGKTPVYAVDGETDVKKWGYTPHKEEEIKGKILQNINASGYRLPTIEEWEYAAKGGKDYKYSGSNDIDEVAWYFDNNDKVTHPVAQKKSNGYGLYDMTGNVWELCWDSFCGCDDVRYIRGGSDLLDANSCGMYYAPISRANDRNYFIGFRIVCSIPN